MFRTKLVFPIDGPRGDQDQVRRLQARRHLVEIDEAGRHAGDEALVLLQLLDRREAALDQIAQRHEAGADPILGDREDRALGLVEQIRSASSSAS